MSKQLHADALLTHSVMWFRREKLSQLRDVGDGIFFRVSELHARPEAIQLARQFQQLTSQSVTAWATSKPWINATDSESLTAEVWAVHSVIEDVCLLAHSCTQHHLLPRPLFHSSLAGLVLG